MCYLSLTKKKKNSSETTLCFVKPPCVLGEQKKKIKLYYVTREKCVERVCM